MGDIEARSLDLDHTWIKIGCYRETDRLNRVLETYQKALTLADSAGFTSEFVSSIVSLHDHKGWLTVVWRDTNAGLSLRKFIDDAWEDQAEHLVTHLSETGEHIGGERK